MCGLAENVRFLYFMEARLGGNYTYSSGPGRNQTSFQEQLKVTDEKPEEATEGKGRSTYRWGGSETDKRLPWWAHVVIPAAESLGLAFDCWSC